MSKTSLLSGLALVLSLLAPTASFAGWGAIACDSKQVCAASWGWNDQGTAQLTALSYCGAQGNGGCYIYMWENNECINGPGGSYACN